MTAVVLVIALTSIANVAIVSVIEVLSGNMRTFGIRFMKPAIDFMNRLDIS